MGFRPLGRYGRARDYEVMRKKREETRKKLDTVKEFEEIENTILIRLNPQSMEELKQIVIDNKQLTYSDLVIFLPKHYRDSQKSKQWSYDHPKYI